MKIDGDITILVSGDGASIEIKDREANTTFCRIEMNPSQFISALGRLAYVRCKSMEVYGMEKLGKKHENKTFEFKLGLVKNIDWNKREAIAKQRIRAKCPKGWQSDNYFNSQDSFFDKEGESWARCTIRRWV